MRVALPRHHQPRTCLRRTDTLNQGASANEKDGKGVPILALAAARKDSEGLHVMQVLVEAGADINAEDLLGQTALFYAAHEGNMDAAKYLLSKGIHGYSPDRDGNVASTIALNADHKDIAEVINNSVKQQVTTQ